MAYRKRYPFSLMGGYPSEPIRTPDPNAIFRQDLFPGMDDPTWSVASTFPAKTPQTPMATKKSGLNWKNFMNAAQKLRSPTGMDFGRVSGRAGGPRPSAPSPRALGVDAAQMATAGDPRKKFWEQGLWRGIMG